MATVGKKKAPRALRRVTEDPDETGRRPRIRYGRIGSSRIERIAAPRWWPVCGKKMRQPLLDLLRFSLITVR